MKRSVEPVRRLTLAVVAAVVLLAGNGWAAADPAQPSPGGEPAHSDELDRFFFRAMNKLSHGDGQSAFDEFSALRRSAFEQGYADLPGYSLKLLYAAQSTAVDNAPESAARTAFLVRRAADLSPGRAEINLAAANFGQALGLAESVKLTAGGIVRAFTEPRLLAGFFINAVLIGLVCLTLALFVVCAVQLATHSDTALAELERVLPVRWRGILGPVVLLFVLCLPLAGGLASALAVWSVFVAWALRGARLIAAVSGMVLLSWTAAFPLLGHVSDALRSPTSAAIDRVNTQAYAEGDYRVLLDALKARPEDPVLQFSAAKLLMGIDRRESRRLFNEAAGGFTDNPQAAEAVKINLAALAHQDRDFRNAKQILSELEGAGVKRFELFYNLALADLALTEMGGHRSNYAKALDLDPGRMRDLEQSEREGALPLAVGLPFWRVFRAFFERSRETSSMLAAESDAFEAFFPSNSPRMAFVFAALVTGVGLWLGRRRTKFSWISSRAGEPSKVWLLLPAGWYLAGDRPFTGVLLLGAMLAGAVMALGRPVSPVELFVFPVPLYYVGWLGAASFFAASVLLPLRRPDA